MRRSARKADKVRAAECSAGNAAGGNYLVHFRHSQRANFCFLDGSVRDESPYSINKALSTNYLRTWRNEQLLGINGY